MPEHGGSALDSVEQHLARVLDAVEPLPADLWATRPDPSLGGWPDGRPWAELWLGTHPNGPTRHADGRPLEAATGALPYLLKVLAAAEPLSLQTHPNAEQARSGFAVGRFRDVITKYQTTRHVEEALMRLTEAYMALGITNEAQTAAAVLGHNPVFWGDRCVTNPTT